MADVDREALYEAVTEALIADHMETMHTVAATLARISRNGRARAVADGGRRSPSERTLRILRNQFRGSAEVAVDATLTALGLDGQPPSTRTT